MILLVADTPVAGTVARLAEWIGQILNIECHALIKRNYPHNAFSIPGGSFGCLPDWENYFARCIRQAHTIIIHNICDVELLELIFGARNPSSCVIYQYHSPPNEPPQYDYASLREYSFDAIFAVAQGYGRFVDGAISVPNVIPDSRPAPVEVPKSKIIFSPHLRSTEYRWSDKFSKDDLGKLRAAEKYFRGFRVADISKVFGREVVTHSEILMYFKAVAVVIDDVNTGLFHQTALESLKAGCAVFSGADLYAIEDFCVAAQVPPPPFIQVEGIDDVLAHLMHPSVHRVLDERMKNAMAYAADHLGERQLAQRYVDILAEHASLTAI